MIKRLKEYRKKAGLTQSKLAEKVGVTQGAIMQWERGMTMPSSKRLMTLAKAVGQSVEALLGGEEYDTADTEGSSGNTGNQL